DFGKRPITVVVIEEIVLSAIVSDEQIEPAVIVIIAPVAAMRRTALIHGVIGRQGGEARERSVAVIAVEKVDPTVLAGIGSARHEQIEVAVIVVISPRHGR